GSAQTAGSITVRASKATAEEATASMLDDVPSHETADCPVAGQAPIAAVFAGAGHRVHPRLTED
ncbi:MAG: hypothetical protein OXH67_12615, partial [Acidimicrobiaceae bacterium]|nr:hypothetical protein [Acidimicrobiaceae bacterium]